MFDPAAGLGAGVCLLPPPPNKLPTALVIPVQALPSNPVTNPAALPSKLVTLLRSIPFNGSLNNPPTRSPTL